MNAYAQALNYAIPVFLILIFVEAVYAWRKGLHVNRSADMISSLSSGITNTVKDVLGLTIVLISYQWFFQRFSLVKIEANWLLYVVAFFALDFSGYWQHRWNHEINFLWNRHIIHHSSEEFNLSCALRQSVSEFFSYFSFLLLPAALLGVPPQVIGIVAPLHLFAQFWYHTRLIGKMGFLETFLVTPSHHRVHHAMNSVYLDKNYGQVFIFWDKWFGTFQTELPDLPPVYGVKRPVRTWNPILINFQHFALLVRDFFTTKNGWDKLRLWFMPTGWRPADAADAHPVSVVNDFSDFKKYDTNASPRLVGWCWFQLFATLAFMFFLTNRIEELGLVKSLWYGAFLFATIWSYTTLLDRSVAAVWVEAFRFVLAFGLIVWQNGDWFGLEAFSPLALIWVKMYFAASLAASLFFWKNKELNLGLQPAN